MPLSESLISPSITPMIARPSPSRIPFTIAGMSAGTIDQSRAFDARDALKLRPTLTNTGLMRRTAAATVSATGKNAESAPSAAFDGGPTPNSRDRNREEHDFRRGRDAVEIRSDGRTQPRHASQRRYPPVCRSTVATTKPTVISRDRHREVRRTWPDRAKQASRTRPQFHASGGTTPA